MNITKWGANPWTSMENAFAGAENMTVTANFAPNLSNLTSLRRMFSGAILANPITTFWDVSNVTDMSFMFQEATSANPNVQNWDISNITSMDGMFEAVALPSADYDAMLLHFDSFSLSQILFDGGDSFYCSRLAQRARNHLDNTWNMSDGGLDPSCGALADDFVLKVDTTLAGTGGNPNTQFEISTSSQNYNVDCNDDGINETNGHTSNYTCDFSTLGGAGIYSIRIMDNIGDNTGFSSLHHTFDAYKMLDVVQWSNAKWTDMSGAFWGASNLTISATDTPDFSNVTNMASMFANAVLVNPDTTNWDTSSVQNMAIMFRGATSANPNTTNWDTSQVTDMRNMFKLATSATLANNGLDTQNVRFMQQMFNGATNANPDTTNWDTSQVENMVAMFQNAFAAHPNTSNWNISQVTSMDFMFAGVTLPTAEYDAILLNFNNQTVNAGIAFSGGFSKYCAIAAHDGLQNNHGWNISDGGLDANCNDVIFRNGFEIPVVIFQKSDGFVDYDFSLIDDFNLDSYPQVIAKGLTKDGKLVIKIAIRKMYDDYQIQISHLYPEYYEQNIWANAKWQNFNNKDKTAIYW